MSGSVRRCRVVPCRAVYLARTVSGPPIVAQVCREQFSIVKLLPQRRLSSAVLTRGRKVTLTEYVFRTYVHVPYTFPWKAILEYAFTGCSSLQ